MNTPRIGIIIATTREGRFGDKAAAWTQTIAAARGDMYLELLDLRDYPMPFFNEPTSPLWAKPKNEVALRWAEKGATGSIPVPPTIRTTNLKLVPKPNSLEFRTVGHEIHTDKASFDQFAQARQWLIRG